MSWTMLAPNPQASLCQAKSRTSALKSLFTGFFATLTIQIADAPNLAGFVVDKFVADGVGILGFIALLIIAFYPGLAKYGVPVFLSFSLVLGGWQIQDQYQLNRQAKSAADIAGQLVRAKFSSKDVEDVTIYANSRFDARVASLWMDSNNSIVLVGSGYEIAQEEIKKGKLYLFIGDIRVPPKVSVIESGGLLVC